MNRLHLWVLLLAVGSTACSEESAVVASEAQARESALEHAQKHLDPRYTCPMHPQVVEDEPGNCPICGMDLVPVKQVSANPNTEQREREILYWVAPMDPSYRRDEPGKSPMGMDLVPVYADEQEGAAVRISPAVVNNIGVRTAEALRRDLPRLIETVGYVDFDESHLIHVHPRTEGWIEALYVRSAGERVKKGDKLFDLYSPTLVNAQEEYLQALNSGNRGLIGASRERLVALGVSRDQIGRLDKQRRLQQYVTIYAPQDGIVGDLDVRDGMYVQPATQVMSLADLSTVWVLAEVFESQVNWVSPGQAARVRLSFLPGREWEGEVDYIYPQLDSTTRTLKVRLRFDNPQELLKPNMYASVSIHGDPRRDAVVVPSESVIRTGKSNRVVLSMGEGRFIAREVAAGMESDGWVVIEQGVLPGDRVVTSAQFLIDSEASQKASLARMQEPAGEEAAEVRSRDATAAEAEAAIEAAGTVRKADVQKRAVMLAHEPIPELDWPGMTMEFAVADDVPLDSLTEGDRVNFSLVPSDDAYRISELRKILTATGRVKEVLPDENAVIVDHEPIPELAWPRMVMEFSVDEEVELGALQQGQTIEFDLREGRDGHVVTAIRPTDEQPE